MTRAQTQVAPSRAPLETQDLARDVFDFEQDKHLDPETLEAVLASLLAMYPTSSKWCMRGTLTWLVVER